MEEREWLAERFEEQPRLRAVAYRMLGSLSEADDASRRRVRLNRTDADAIENLGGWLDDRGGSRLAEHASLPQRREEPLDVRLPDPIVDRPDGMNPEHEALLADSVGLALIIVLETLSPPERLSFVLHDMFGVPFDEIAPIVDRSPEAARQLASRARRRLQAENPVPDADLATQRAADASWRQHAKGTSRRCSKCSTSTWCCAQTSVSGESRVVRRDSLFTRRCSTRVSAWICGLSLVNGAVGGVAMRDGEPFSVGAMTVRRGKIVELNFFNDPERLASSTSRFWIPKAVRPSYLATSSRSSRLC